MKKYYSFLVFPLAIIFIAYAVYSNTTKVNAPEGIVMPPAKTISESSLDEKNKNSIDTTRVFYPPLRKSQDRTTKKTFGTFVTPQNSPVQPERFQGHHTGVDFEIFPEEMALDVSVKAVCEGKMLAKKFVSGYGGATVTSCEIDSQPVTVIYGHLKLSSIAKNIGDSIKSGDVIGILGSDKSPETDGERKHLHLGIHQGADINLKGYVQNQSELSDWLDPCLFVCHD